MSSAVRVLRGEGFARDVAEELQRADTGAISADSVKRHFEATGRLLKGDPHSAVYLAQLAGRHCYCKLFFAKSSRQRLLFRLNRSRGQRSFDVAHRLRALALPVPEPLACIGLPGAVLFVTDVAPGTDLKALWLQQVQAGDWPAALAACGLAMAQLHAAGFSHGDTKWSNLLWDGATVTLVDLDAVRHSADRSRRARDLARFTLNAEEMNVPAALYEHFLLSYGNASGESRATLEKLTLRALHGLRRRHLKRYGPRGHRLLGETNHD